ncbi:CAP domain-containing protein [Flagellimonas sp. S3867]|uniref:CAP domain-containing protein n=1 Tax=Flagellimonas sp. S3867 TaxID=2768063 RepID=UPI001684AFCA|nr:CAP domain-containing protein [Flagellimonas sp. S3867]
MKKLYYAFLAAASVVVLSTCSKSSSVEEQTDLSGSFPGNEKVVIDASKMEEAVLDMVNEHRSSIGVSALISSPSSYKYAQEHNTYMISKNKLSHDNFDARASDIATEINAVEVGENVARFYSSAALVVEGWLNSTSHKETLEKAFTHTTLSVQLDKDGRPYFTQIFMKIESNNP